MAAAMQAQAKMKSLVHATPKGLYCEPGDFYIDPWHPVETAIITHGHSDHARLSNESIEQKVLRLKKQWEKKSVSPSEIRAN